MNKKLFILLAINALVVSRNASASEQASLSPTSTDLDSVPQTNSTIENSGIVAPNQTTVTLTEKRDAECEEQTTTDSHKAAVQYMEKMRLDDIANAEAIKLNAQKAGDDASKMISNLTKEGANVAVTPTSNALHTATEEVILTSKELHAAAEQTISAANKMISALKATKAAKKS